MQEYLNFLDVGCSSNIKSPLFQVDLKFFPKSAKLFPKIQYSIFVKAEMLGPCPNLPNTICFPYKVSPFYLVLRKTYIGFSLVDF